MSVAPLDASMGERIQLPWRFFRRRLIVMFELFAVTKLMSIVGVGGDSSLLIATLALVFLIAFFYLALGSSPGQIVREVALRGEFLTYSDRKRVHRLDLSQARKASVRRLPFCIPALELWFDDPEVGYHAVPLIGESGRRILDHVLAHIPGTAKPQVIGTLLKPYKPGLFRPREESLPLPEVR